MAPDPILLALLLIGLVVTRPLEERLWRAGRVSDRTSAVLVVARLPALALGFALITAEPLGATLLMVGIATGIAALLLPRVIGRLGRVRGGR